LKIKNDGLNMGEGQKEICYDLLLRFFSVFILHSRAVIFGVGFGGKSSVSSDTSIFNSSSSDDSSSLNFAFLIFNF
jgi:hypothetical protein